MQQNDVNFINKVCLKPPSMDNIFKYCIQIT